MASTVPSRFCLFCLACFVVTNGTPLAVMQQGKNRKPLQRACGLFLAAHPAGERKRKNPAGRQENEEDGKLQGGLILLLLVLTATAGKQEEPQRRTHAQQADNGEHHGADTTGGGQYGGGAVEKMHLKAV